MGSWGLAYLTAPLEYVVGAILANTEEVKKLTSGAKIVMSCSTSQSNQARDAPIFHWHREGLVWNTQKCELREL